MERQNALEEYLNTVLKLEGRAHRALSPQSQHFLAPCKAAQRDIPDSCTCYSCRPPVVQRASTFSEASAFALRSLLGMPDAATSSGSQGAQQAINALPLTEATRDLTNNLINNFA